MHSDPKHSEKQPTPESRALITARVHDSSAKAGGLPDTPHLSDIFLKRLIRAGLGTIPVVGPILVEATFGVRDDVVMMDVLARLEAIQERLGDSATPQEMISRLKDEVVLESGKLIGFREPTGAFSPLEPLARDLEGLQPTLERQAKSLKVSEGTLMKRRKPYRREGANITVGDLEVGYLFFPLNFLRRELFLNPSCFKMIAQFRSLFDPADCNGSTKFICMEFEKGQCVLTAYPRPIILDTAGKPGQLKEVVSSASDPFKRFEYWPDGNRKDKRKFIVSMHFGNTPQLEFAERTNPNSAILKLDMLVASGLDDNATED